VNFPPFPAGYRPRACSCTLRRCPRRTASAMSGREPSSGSIDSGRPDKAGGRSCPEPTGTATLRINHCPLCRQRILVSPDWLIETDCYAPGTAHRPVCGNRRRLRHGYPVQTPIAGEGLENFRAGACPELKAPFEQFCQDQAHWLEDHALFQVLKANTTGSLPRMAGRADPARSGRFGRSPARSGDPVRSGLFYTIPAVPQANG